MTVDTILLTCRLVLPTAAKAAWNAKVIGDVNVKLGLDRRV